MFKISNVTLSYKTYEGLEKVVLNDVSLTFPENGICFIVGKSGCGKSSLLNLLANLLKPIKGDIYYKDKNLKDFTSDEKISFYQSEISLMYQSYNLFNKMTVYENIKIACDVSNKSASLIDGYLEKFSLTPLKDMIIDDLSGGEKQRVALIRSLIKEPNVLLCDEPTGAVDEANEKIIINALREYAQNHLVIIVTHNKDLITCLDNVVRLKDGKVEDTKLECYKNIKYEPFKKKARIKNKLFSKRLEKVHRFKYVLLLVALSFSFTITMLGFNFYNNLNTLSYNLKNSYSNYNCFKVSNVKTIKEEGTLISYVKKERPTYSEVSDNFNFLNNADITYNLDYFLNNATVKINEKEYTNVKVKFYSDGNYDERVIVNDLFYNLENAGKFVDISLNNSYTYETIKDEVYYKIDNVFTYSESHKISYITNEFLYLNEPTIYLNYFYFENFLDNYYCDAIYDEIGEKISWLDLVKICKNNEDLGGFSMNLWVYDTNNYLKIIDFKSKNNDLISLDNNGFEVVNSFMDILKIVSVGIIFFSSISLISTFAILFFTLINQILKERKNIAVLKTLGYSTFNVFTQFFKPLLLYFLGSIFIGAVLIIGITFIVNYVAFDKMHIINMISSFTLNNDVLPIILLIIISILIILIAYIIASFVFNKLKKLDIARELSEE
ncbi:MAG: ATP-binding cassette domain-containing protein [Bacilli bacterium]|nr:ATP-binding cassette domain-containing protein [Bacilli bacterium]